MFRRVADSLSSLVLLFGLYCMSMFGQGTPSWSAYDGGQVDMLNIQTLAPVLNVQAMSKSGSFPFVANYTGGDSYVYKLGSDLNPGINAVPIVLSVNSSLGALGAPTLAIAGGGGSGTCPEGYGSGSAVSASDWYVALADGTRHYLPTTDVSYFGLNCLSGFTGTTIDGSGYTVTVSGVTVVSIYASNGALLSPSSITDSNGNTITYASGAWTDTLGMADTLTQSGLNATWQDVAGGAPTITVSSTSTATLKSVFACSGAADYDSSSNTLVDSFTFPDGGTINLTWEQTPGYANDLTGRLETIKLRSGGTVTYNYNPSGAGASEHYGLNCTYLIPNSVTRATSDGTITYTTSFSSSAPYVETVTKVDIGKNKTIYTFTGFTATGTASLPDTQALTETQYFTNVGSLSSPSYSSVPTKQIVYCYNSTATNSSGCPTATVALPVSEVSAFTQLGGGSALTPAAWTQTKFDAYGNVTYSAQYDFGATTPTIATTNTYSPTGSCGPSSTVNNKLCTSVTTVLNGTTAYTVASSKYTYSSQGNLLTSYVSENGGFSFLSNPTVNSYLGNGTPHVTYDLAGNPTTFGYSSGSYTDCSGCTNFPFPTSMTTGGLTTAATYYGAGGVKHTHTDASGNVTTYGYTDPWNRVTSITDPLTNVIYKTYSPTSQASTFGFNSGLSVNNTTVTLDGYARPILTQTQQGPSSSNWDTTSTTYHFAPTGAVSDNAVSVTIPCSEPSGTPCGNGTGNNNVYTDMLGRTVETSNSNGSYVGTSYTSGTSGSTTREDLGITRGPAPTGENLKQSIDEYDGLGRKTIHCDLSSTVSGHANCGTVTQTSATGIVTSTQYTSATGSQTVASTRGSQTRSKTVDGMGRTTSVTTPEGGTTTYTYDSVAASNCGNAYSYPGKLLRTLFANGVELCYASYDSLGRLTAIEGNYTNNSEPGWCTRFFYDNSVGAWGALPSGISPANSYGRMVEAETDTCASWPVTSSSNITDEWFSYDKDGRVTDTWQLTPNSGGYYHSSATFFGNSAIDTVTTTPSVGAVTYNIDGEGRWNYLEEGGTVIVQASGVAYNAASQPTQIKLGTGYDNDAYTYDANTNQMKTWDFTVGSASQSAILTWNSNWSLNNLAITDGFYSGGTQTCYFNPSGGGVGYDDLGRLVNDNCGSVWAQTFSYDQYNNLTKAGSVIFNPGYSTSPSNNHYASSFGATYDTSGNLTYDTFHYYTWNGYNRMASIDASGTNCGTSGECLVYDALNRLVEIDSGGTATEIWYTHTGRAFMQGSTLQYAYVNSPGGGTTYVASGGVPSWMHKDWLGNARVVSSIPGQTIGSDRAYAPYGEIYETFGGSSASYFMFGGGMTQDVSLGMYNAANRELPPQSRWLSPDPAGAGWNQYAYSTNPNSNVDPSGLAPLQYLVTGTGMGVFGSLLSWSMQLDGSAKTIANAEVYGTVGADASSQTPTSAASSGFSSTPGQYTGTYEPPGWNGGQQQVWTPDGGPDLPAEQPPTPALELTGPLGSIFPVAGCGGHGIPCMALPYTLGIPWAKGSASGNSYSYSVVDQDRNPIQGAPVTEWYQNALEPGSAWTNGEGGGNTWPNFSGAFIDFLGFGPGPSNMFLLNQMFTVQMGGINYLLTTETQQFAIQNSYGSVFTNVTITTK